MRRAAMFVARALAIALVFATARTLAVLISDGLSSTDVWATFRTEVAAGVVLGAWLQFIIPDLAGSHLQRAVAVAVLVFVNVVAVMIEGAAFQPAAQPLSLLPAGVLLQLTVASLVGLATVMLNSEPRPLVARRPLPPKRPTARLARYLACVTVYIVTYFVFGAINFALVTGPYYATRSAGLTVPPAEVVLLVATVEGALLPLALLPLLSGLHGSRRRRLLIGGASLFILGGAVPLIVAPGLAGILRVASGLEIFLQKFPTGVATAALLGSEHRT